MIQIRIHSLDAMRAADHHGAGRRPSHDGREQEACDCRREELSRHDDEDGLLRALREELLRDDHAGEVSHVAGGADGEHNPDDRDDRGLL